MTDEDRLLVAAATTHRACCGSEHDPSVGKLHGCCVVCGVSWPCDTASIFIDAARRPNMTDDERLLEIATRLMAGCVVDRGCWRSEEVAGFSLDAAAILIAKWRARTGAQGREAERDERETHFIDYDGHLREMQWNPDPDVEGFRGIYCATTPARGREQDVSDELLADLRRAVHFAVSVSDETGKRVWGPVLDRALLVERARAAGKEKK